MSLKWTTSILVLIAVLQISVADGLGVNFSCIECDKDLNGYNYTITNNYDFPATVMVWMACDGYASSYNNIHTLEASKSHTDTLVVDPIESVESRLCVVRIMRDVEKLEYDAMRTQIEDEYTSTCGFVCADDACKPRVDNSINLWFVRIRPLSLISIIAVVLFFVMVNCDGKLPYFHSAACV